MSSVLRKKCVRLYETGKNVLMHAKVVLMQQERHGGSFELGGQTSKKVVILRGELFSPKVKTACVEGGLFFSCRFCLRRSPDHGTVDVVVVVVLLLLGGTTLIFDFFQDTEIFIK